MKESPMATATLEDLAALFVGTPDMLDLMRSSTKIQEGIQDLITRLRNVEHDDLRNAARLTILEKQQADHEAALQTFAKDRADAAGRITNPEKNPTDLQKQVTELSERLRSVEGAVGSKHFTAPPPKPFVVPDVPEPPKPTFGE